MLIILSVKIITLTGSFGPPGTNLGYVTAQQGGFGCPHGLGGAGKLSFTFSEQFFGSFLHLSQRGDRAEAYVGMSVCLSTEGSTSLGTVGEGRDNGAEELSRASCLLQLSGLCCVALVFFFCFCMEL